jgi:hypothetical protein
MKRYFVLIFEEKHGSINNVKQFDSLSMCKDFVRGRWGMTRGSFTLSEYYRMPFQVIAVTDEGIEVIEA